MEKILIILGALALLAVGFVYFWKDSSPVNIPDEAAAREVVINFGAKLKMVSLSAPKEEAAKAIYENYAGLVSEDILEFWESDPSQAPGRRASSPWPDRIEIDSITLNEDGSYDVQARIIEVTSVEITNGGAATEIKAALKLRKREGKWIITGFTEAVPRS